MNDADQRGTGHTVTRKTTALLGLVAVGVVACGRETPTSVDETLLPDEPISIEIRMGWDDFASGLEVIGGYGSPLNLGRGVLANGYGGTLQSRAVAMMDTFPASTSVRDTTGTTRTDSVLTFVGARLVAKFDTISSTNTGPVTLAVGAITQRWDPQTVTWTHTVDTINDLRAWDEEGAGPVLALATGEWDPATGDSVSFSLDSAQVALWTDTIAEAPGLRIDLLTEGYRLEVQGLFLRLTTRPSVNPDTLVEVTGHRRYLTSVYSPFPEPPPDGIRVGGAPAWRTVLDLNVPTVLNGPAELCAAVGCPVTLTADQLNYAALVLRSRASEAGFQPSDTIGLDIRPVLDRDALPKSPLGSSLIGTLGRRVGPEAFGAAPGVEIEIPLTAFARAILRGEEDGGTPPPKTLALLSVFEPVSISFASFFGPGVPEEPVLKLVVTVGKTVELP
jgi:hypothetical protein